MEFLRVGPAREWQLSQETVQPGEKLLPATQAICTSEHFVVFVEELFCFNKHVVIILILLSLNSFDSIVAKFCFSSL